jgi:hypothetical protein
MAIIGGWFGVFYLGQQGWNSCLNGFKNKNKNKN